MADMLESDRTKEQTMADGMKQFIKEGGDVQRQNERRGLLLEARKRAEALKEEVAEAGH